MLHLKNGNENPLTEKDLKKLPRSGLVQQYSRWNICHLSCKNVDVFPHIHVNNAIAEGQLMAGSS